VALCSAHRTLQVAASRSMADSAKRKSARARYRDHSRTTTAPALRKSGNAAIRKLVATRSRNGRRRPLYSSRGVSSARRRAVRTQLGSGLALDPVCLGSSEHLMLEIGQITARLVRAGEAFKGNMPEVKSGRMPERWRCSRLSQRVRLFPLVRHAMEKDIVIKDLMFPKKVMVRTGCSAFSDWVMVLIFVSFGIQKFTPQAADGIALYISNSRSFRGCLSSGSEARLICLAL